MKKLFTRILRLPAILRGLREGGENWEVERGVRGGEIG